MGYKELLKQLEESQTETNEIAFKYLNESEEIGMLVVMQSYCDFNLFWFSSISPVIMHSETIKFLLRNKVDIKGKFTMKQLMDFDTKYRTLIRYYEIETIKEYKEALNKYYVENE